MTHLIGNAITVTMRGMIRRTSHTIPDRRHALAPDLALQGSVGNTDIKIGSRPTIVLQPVSKLCEITLLILGAPTFSITDHLAQRLTQFSKTSRATVTIA